MNATWIIAWMKSKVVIAVLIVLLLFGVLQFFTTPSEQFNGLNFSQGYALVNNMGIACFVYVPVFGLILSRIVKSLYATQVLLALRSRRKIAYYSLSCSLQQAACYTAGVNIASTPLMFAYYQPDLNWILPIVATMLLQTLFFAVCAALFCLLFIISRTSSVPFVSMLVYGLWDYLASSTVGGGVPFTGWALTIVQVPISWIAILRSAAFFGMILCLLLLVFILVVDKMDLLSKRET